MRVSENRQSGSNNFIKVSDRFHGLGGFFAQLDLVCFERSYATFKRADHGRGFRFNDSIQQSLDLSINLERFGLQNFDPGFLCGQSVIPQFLEHSARAVEESFFRRVGRHIPAYEARQRYWRAAERRLRGREDFSVRRFPHASGERFYRDLKTMLKRDPL